MKMLRNAKHLMFRCVIPAFCLSTVPTTIGVTAVTSTSGCASFLNNPVYVAQQLAQYVTLFVQTAQTVWATIAPLLGANQAADTVAFNDAVVALENANGVMIDVAQAIAAGKTGNLQQAIAAVQDAVSRVMAVITQFQSGSPAAASATADRMINLSHMAASIQHWQEAK